MTAYLGAKRTNAHPPPEAVVAIPVRNERDHIVHCLRALDGQQGATDRSFGLVLFLNNCSDGTQEVVANIAPTLSFPVRVIVDDNPDASAGWARRNAMDHAAAWLGTHDDGILLTTDADSRVSSDWIVRNRAALAAGADLVAGRLALAPEDDAVLPLAVRARGALEAEYEVLLTAIAARLDPIPYDPWPNHRCHSGATLATSLRFYRDIGGMPGIACGEDRAFVEAAIARDGRVRHDPDIVVVTSGRLQGRALGGVADTIRLRCDVPDSPCDDLMEPVARVAMRLRVKAHLRRLHAARTIGAIRRLLDVLLIPPDLAGDLVASPSFGALHLAVERASPLLAFQPIRPSALPCEIARARRLVRLLTPRDRNMRCTDRPPISRDRTAAEACD